MDSLLPLIIYLHDHIFQLGTTPSCPPSNKCVESQRYSLKNSAKCTTSLCKTIWGSHLFYAQNFKLLKSVKKNVRSGHISFLYFPTETLQHYIVHICMQIEIEFFHIYQQHCNQWFLIFNRNFTT